MFAICFSLCTCELLLSLLWCTGQSVLDVHRFFSVFRTFLQWQFRVVICTCIQGCHAVMHDSMEMLFYSRSLAASNAWDALLLQSMISGVCLSRGFMHKLCKHTWMDRSPAWGGDSWGPKEHCIKWVSVSITDSMQPSPDYFGLLLYWSMLG